MLYSKLYQEPLAELKKDIGEIWVEETIEDGVGAAGGDSDQVANEVSQHHGLWKCGKIFIFEKFVSFVSLSQCYVSS